jgi:hypothetical protein
MLAAAIDPTPTMSGDVRTDAQRFRCTLPSGRAFASA